MASTRILVDTSILIEYFRKKHKERTILYRYAEDAELCISTITEYEFWVGATASSQQFIRDIVTMVNILPFDSACVQTAIAIHHQLKPINRKLPIQDTFIAATAIRHNLPLLTLNTKHFANIPNLMLVEIE